METPPGESKPSDSQTGRQGSELRQGVPSSQRSRHVETSTASQSSPRPWHLTERQLRRFLNDTLDGIIVLDQQGLVLFINRQVELLTGKTASQLLGTHFGVPPAPGTSSEIDIVRAPHDIRTVEMRCVEITWQDQSAFLASLHDVTAQRFLAESSALLSRSLDSYNILQTSAVLATKYLATWSLIQLKDESSRARVIVGAHSDPYRQPILKELQRLSCVGPVSAAVQSVIDTGVPEVQSLRGECLADRLACDPLQRSLIHRLGCSSGTVVPLTARSKTLGALILIESESSRSQTPDSLELAEDFGRRCAMALDNAMLYESSLETVRRHDEFLAMLAHELRNPLMPITAATDVLRRNSQVPATADRQLAAIERSTRHLARMVDDLLDVSRITRGVIQLRMAEVDVVQLLQESVDAVRQTTTTVAHHITVTMPQTPAIIRGDATRLSQIFINLLNNAVKYTPAGGAIDVQCQLINSQVVVSVADNGQGIAPERLQHIFDMFVQADQGLDRRAGGLGIGLTLVKRLVEDHGGMVCAESPGLGQGSRFTVSFRAISSANVTPTARPPVPAVRARSSSHTTAPLRIVIVDDNDDVREMLAELLRMLGHEVNIACDGHYGIECILQEKPDVALIDIGLPRCDGYEVARTIRNAPGGEQTVLIAVSGYGKPSDRSNSKQAGFDQHLVKPVSLERLLEAIAEHVEKRATVR